MGVFDLKGALSVAKNSEVIDYLRNNNTDIKWDEIDKQTQEALAKNPILDKETYTIGLLSKNPISQIDKDALTKIKELESKAEPQNFTQKGLDFINEISTATDALLPTKLITDPLLAKNEEYKKRKEAQREAIELAYKNNIDAKDLSTKTQDAILDSNGARSELLRNPFDLRNPTEKAQEILAKNKKLDNLLYKDYGDLSDDEKELFKSEDSLFERAWDSIFSDDEERFEEFKELRYAKEHIAPQITKQINTLQQFHEGQSIRGILNSEQKEKYLDDVASLVSKFGFDGAGVSEEGDLYLLKENKQYRVNDGFFDNFWDILYNAKGEIGGGIAGSIYGFKSGKTTQGKMLGSIAGGAVGSALGAGADIIAANAYLNRENTARDILGHSLEAGLLSAVGDSVILGVSRYGKEGIKKLAQSSGKLIDETAIGGFIRNLPTQNLKGAEELINHTLNKEEREAIKKFGDEFGGNLQRGEGRFDNLLELSKDLPPIFQNTADKILKTLNKPSLKERQLALIEEIRADKSGNTLAFLLEAANTSPEIQNNLKSILNQTTRNFKKELEKLNIANNAISQVFKEMERENKAGYNEAINVVLKDLYKDERVVLNRQGYDKFRENLNKQGIASEESHNFLSYLESVLYRSEGVGFNELNNARKLLNSYYKEAKDPNFKDYIKTHIQGFLRDDINRGLDTIFKSNPQTYLQASQLYSTALSDYATIKEILKLKEIKNARDISKNINVANDSLVSFLKGQGDEIDNITKIKEATRGNAELELGLLNNLINKSLISDDTLEVFNSSYFKEQIKGLESLFTSKEAKELLELIDGFNTLFVNDGKIALALKPANTQKEGYGLAQSISGAINQKAVKIIFEGLLRNLPKLGVPLTPIKFSTFNEKIQGAALRYHIRSALKNSINIQDFKKNLQTRGERARFNTKTQELLQTFLKDIDTGYKSGIDILENEKDRLVKKQSEVREKAKANGIYNLRKSAKNTLKDKINTPITNKHTQEVATLTNNGIRKMISDKAVQKSVDNGFSREEHFNAVEKVDELFQNATKVTSKVDINDENLIIHRYNAPFKDANALLTLKEYKENGKTIYSLELENLSAIKFNPSGKDLMEQSSKSKDADTTNFRAPIENPKEHSTTNLTLRQNTEPLDDDIIDVELIDESKLIEWKRKPKDEILPTLQKIAENNNLKRNEVYKFFSLLDSKVLQENTPLAIVFKKEAKKIGVIKEPKGIDVEQNLKEPQLNDDIAREWLDTFNLKSLDESYIPAHNDEIKEALKRAGINEIKLTKGSLIKLINEHRLKYLERIKPTLDEPDRIILQDENTIIFAKNFGEIKHFTSVARTDGNEWIIRSNAPKSENGLNNKIKKGGKEIYNQADAQINANAPYDDKANSNIKLDKHNSTTNLTTLETNKVLQQANSFKNNLVNGLDSFFNNTKISKASYAKYKNLKLDEFFSDFEVASINPPSYTREYKQRIAGTLSNGKIFEIFLDSPFDTKQNFDRFFNINIADKNGNIEKELFFKEHLYQNKKGEIESLGITINLQANGKNKYLTYKKDAKSATLDISKADSQRDKVSLNVISSDNDFNEFLKLEQVGENPKERKYNNFKITDKHSIITDEWEITALSDDIPSSFNTKSLKEAKEIIDELNKPFTNEETNKAIQALKDAKLNGDNRILNYPAKQSFKNKKDSFIFKTKLAKAGLSDKFEFLHNFKDLEKVDKFLKENGQPFGINFIIDKEQQPIKILLEAQCGHIENAFYKDELGYIDLVWGDEKMGLAKILEKHAKAGEFKEFGGDNVETQMQNAITQIIDKGEIINENGRLSIVLNKDNKIYRLGLKSNWKGEPTDNKWIITAYEDTREANKTIRSDGFTKEENLSLNSKDDSTTNLDNRALKESENLNSQNTKNQEKINKILDEFSKIEKEKDGAFDEYAKRKAEIEKITDTEKARALYDELKQEYTESEKKYFRKKEKDFYEINKIYPTFTSYDELLKENPRNYLHFEILRERANNIYHEKLQKAKKENITAQELQEALSIINDFYVNYMKTQSSPLRYFVTNKKGGDSSVYFRKNKIDNVKDALTFKTNFLDDRYNTYTLNYGLIATPKVEKAAKLAEKYQQIQDYNKNIAFSEVGKELEKERLKVVNKLENKIQHNREIENKTHIQTNQHITAGLLGGSISGIEQDEEGNISINPAKFLLGFLGGAGGSKGFLESKRLLDKKPALKEKLTQELSDSLKNGWDRAVKEYPFLNLLDSKAHIIKNEKGRLIQAKSLIKELVNKQGNIIVSNLNKYAINLPKALSKDEFINQIPQKDKRGYSKINTPIGEININLQHAYNHLNKGNTYKKDRLIYSGAFLDTLTDPLFIVKQKYINNPKLSLNGEKMQNAKPVQTKDKEILAKDSYVYFKPYKIKDNFSYLVGYNLDIKGKIINTTFIPMGKRDLAKIRKMLESEILYFKDL